MRYHMPYLLHHPQIPILSKGIWEWWSRYGMWYLISKLSKSFCNESDLLFLLHHWGRLTSDLRVVKDWLCLKYCFVLMRFLYRDTQSTKACFWTHPSSLDVDLHYPCVSTHHDVNEKPTFVLYHPADAMLWCVGTNAKVWYACFHIFLWEEGGLN